MVFTEGSLHRMQKGRIHSIHYGKKKGMIKKAMNEAMLIENFGLKGDAHGGPGIRQVSLLAVESIRKQKECSKVKDKEEPFQPGDFDENITTEGLDLTQLKVGDRFKIGKKIILKLSKIGKECHKHCATYYKTGDCIMPGEGIFAEVIKGGRIAVGEDVKVSENAK